MARRFSLAAALALLPFGAVRAATLVGKEHRVTFQVSSNDKAVMNLTLNNIGNLQNEFHKLGQTVQMELVAFGPGLNMLRDDTSPVKARLTQMKEAMPNLTLSACNNTKMAMERAEGHEIIILPVARIVPAGIVRLINLQEQGWAYIRA
ncbi:MAG: DsrE family protein [Rhodospirillales bacterium]|nr:DsrE family protein [Rhodospirillales bacterium]